MAEPIIPPAPPIVTPGKQPIKAMVLPVPPPPLTLAQRQQLFTMSPEQIRMSELRTLIRDAEAMRDIYEQLCISCLKGKGVYNAHEPLGDLVARYMSNQDFNLLLVSAHSEARKRGYKKGYRNMGNPEELKKELNELLAGGEVKK